MDTLGALMPKKTSSYDNPGLELITFKEVGNPLLDAGDDERSHFRKLVEKRLDELRRRPQNGKLDGTTFTPLVDEGRGGAEQTLEYAAKAIGDEIWASAAGNPMLSSHIFKEYWEKLTGTKFQHEELMTPLLIAQEELLFPDMPGGADKLTVSVPVFNDEEFAQQRQQPPIADTMLPQPSAPFESGFMQRADEFPPEQPMARKPVPVQPDILEVRLVSIREMLKHYFREYPEDYSKALACALGLVADESGDAEFMEQRVAFEVARVGSWAVSLRLLEEVRKRMEKKDGKGPEPWRMGLRVGRGAKRKKPWAYSPGKSEAIFCPRWCGLNWSVSLGMLPSLISRK